MLDKRRYTPIGYKLMISYALFILIPMVVVGFFTYMTFVQSLKEQAQTNVTGTLRQVKENVLFKLKDTVKVSDILYYDTVLSAQVKQAEGGWHSYNITTKYLIPTFHATIESTNQDIWLRVYLKNDQIPEIYHSEYDQKNLLDTKMKVFEIFHLSRIENRPWYTSFPMERYGSTWQWKRIESDKENGNISLLRRLMDNTDPLDVEQIGYMRLIVRMEDVFQSIDYRKIGEGTKILLLNQNEVVEYFSGSDELMIGEKWDRGLGDDHLIIREELPGIDWQLVAMIPNRLLERDAKKVRNITVLICVGGFIVFSFLGMMASRYYARRVEKIVSVLNYFQEGAFHKRMNDKGKDEFGDIITALNQMGENTEKMIQEVYLSQIQKREAELEMLQAQINPHFLYNTLSSISRLSKYGKNEQLNRMVTELAKFYRLSLSKGKTIIRIEQELDHAMAYLQIQKMKYGERLKLSCEFDENVLGYHTVKIILQPFLENVLEHSWYGDSIYIRMTAMIENDTIIFKIIDDGVGISKETIQQIFSPADGVYLGYGIRNVDQRIKLHFGPSYGVRIDSRPGGGTTVLITIPALAQ